jgi:hypothetical protein
VINVSIAFSDVNRLELDHLLASPSCGAINAAILPKNDRVRGLLHKLRAEERDLLRMANNKLQVNKNGAGTGNGAAPSGDSLQKLEKLVNTMLMTDDENKLLKELKGLDADFGKHFYHADSEFNLFKEKCVVCLDSNAGCCYIDGCSEAHAMCFDCILQVQKCPLDSQANGVMRVKQVQEAGRLI